MKNRFGHVLAVWKTTLDWRMPYMLFMAVFFYWILGHSLGYRQHSLDAVVSGLMGPLIWMAIFYYHWIFKSGMWKGGGMTDDAAQGGWGSLEFFFSRAVSRRAVFAVRVGLFLLILVLPWIGYLAHACLHPDLVLALYDGAGGNASRFYHVHFPDASWKIEPAHPYQWTVTLPGGVLYAVGGAGALYLAGAVLYQMVMEMIRERWLQIGVTAALFLAYIGFPLLGLHWRSLSSSPSFGEQAIAWIAVHPMWAYPGLIVLVVGVEWVCCRRFVRKEIL